MTLLRREAREYLYVDITLDVDPIGSNVDIRIDGVWRTAEWDDVASYDGDTWTRTAILLLAGPDAPPGDEAVVLASGRHLNCAWRVSTDTEAVVRGFGTLDVAGAPGVITAPPAGLPNALALTGTGTLTTTGPPITPPAGPTPLRVTSWNIKKYYETSDPQYGDYPAGYWDWTTPRINAVVNELILSNPAVMGLQEIVHKATATVSMRDTLMAALASAAPGRFARIVAANRTATQSTNLNEIVYDTTLLTPTVAGSTNSGWFEFGPPDQRDPPSYVYALYCRFTHTASGKRFMFATTHLAADKYGDDQTRYEQAQNLIATIEAKAGVDPCIFTGDFNSHYGRNVGGFDGPQVAMTEAGYRNSVEYTTDRITIEYNSGNDITNPPLKRPVPGTLGYHLDHIYIDPAIGVTQFEERVRLAAPGGNYVTPFLSDHNLIRAVLTL